MKSQNEERHDDLERELKSDLEMEEEEQRERGLPAEEAHYAARRALGNTALIHDQTHAAWGRKSWGVAQWERLVQDIRFALRQIVRKPGFAAAVVLTMALGIGANAAIFSVLDAVLLRPLPYTEPQGLIKVWTRFTGIGQPNDQNWVSAPEFRDFEELNHSFSALAAISGGSFNLGVKGSPQRVVGASVSTSLFPMLGAQPMLGRLFLPEEGQPGRDRELILSYGLWRRVFAANPKVVGSTLDIDGVPMTVVGVMPEGFAYPDETEIWGPLSFSPDDLSEDSRGSHQFEVLGRIRPGLSLAQVQEDMDRVARTMMDEHRSYPYAKYNFGIILHPLLEETVGDVRQSLIVLMAAVVLVLLIACANIANLLLTRATERRHEMETRLALGARGARLLRQLLTESVVLALAGGLVGLAATPFLLRGLVALAARTLPRAVNTGIDLRALALTAAVSLATGILFGLAPALEVSRLRSFDGLKSGRNTEGRKPRRLRSALIIGETALSVLLVAGAGLLLRSFTRILAVDPGFRPDGVLTLRVALPGALYSKPEQIRGFYSDLLTRVRSLPGVRAAGAISALPVSGLGGSGTTTIDTDSVPMEDRSPEADQRVVTPGYFEAMGITLLRGRTFDDHDTAGATPVAIIDETMASTFWPGQDPIGRRLHIGGAGNQVPWTTVVGVVRHVRNRSLETRSRVEVYWPAYQQPANAMALAVLASGNPMSLAPTIQRDVATIDPDLPVYRVRTMAQVMGDSLLRRRLALVLLATFAGLALLLACVGIYGVTAYGVAQRQVEIGVRMALGADRAQVLRLIMAGGAATIAFGLALGLALSLFLTRVMRGLLFSVQASDPLALGGAVILLLLAALLAIFLPALRATRVNPMAALRCE
jgi:putative ABC transport system permease protein